MILHFDLKSFSFWPSRPSPSSLEISTCLLHRQSIYSMRPNSSPPHPEARPKRRTGIYLDFSRQGLSWILTQCGCLEHHWHCLRHPFPSLQHKPKGESPKHRAEENLSRAFENGIMLEDLERIKNFSDFWDPILHTDWVIVSSLNMRRSA